MRDGIGVRFSTFFEYPHFIILVSGLNLMAMAFKKGQRIAFGNGKDSC